MNINIFKNLKLKLASVLTAFILWLLVTAGHSSIIDFNIPLQFSGLSEHLAIAGDYQDIIDVRVKAADTTIQQLTASEIDGALNLSGLQEGEHIIPMTFDKIRVPFGVEVVKVNPSRITLTIQKKIEKKVPIMPLLVGRVADGYEQVGAKVEPPLATIIGAEGDVNSVEKVSTDAILFANKDSSFTVSAKVIVDNPNVSVADPSVALVEVSIAEIEEEKEFVDLPVIVQNSQYKVKLDPEKLMLMLSGAKSRMDNLTEENIIISLNLADLKPRGTSYEILPLIEFEPVELNDAITIIKVTPEKIKVRVYNTRIK